jgi:hypothetical protein
MSRTQINRPELPLQKLDRKDNPLECLALGLASFLLALISPNRQQIIKEVRMSYKSFVKTTKMMLKEAFVGSWSTLEMSIAIQRLLRSILPQPLRKTFQDTYKHNPKYLCEASAQWMTFGLIEFLVGKVERFYIPTETMNITNPTQTEWLSGVKLIECRYLSEVGCKSACIHLCKIPTQNLFMEDLGLPLTMKPNYDDCSCEMQFGVLPPPIEQDPALETLCYKSCSLSIVKKKTQKKNGDNAYVCRTDCL